MAPKTMPYCSAKERVKLARGVSAIVTTAITMLKASKDGDRLGMLFSQEVGQMCRNWSDAEYFGLLDRVVEEFYQDNWNLFCQCLREDRTPFGQSLPGSFATYLIDRWMKLVEARTDKQVNPHSNDVLDSVKWIYERVASVPMNVGKVNQLVRLCGEALPLFWVDNYCRRSINPSRGWERCFRKLLAKGMEERVDPWDSWNLASGFFLDQSNPEHYSRQDLLKEWIATINWTVAITTPDGQRQVQMYIRELAKLTTRKETINFLASMDFPPSLMPEE